MLNNIPQQLEHESHAVARKPRDAAAVLFGLKLADNNIHNKFKCIAKLRKVRRLLSLGNRREYPHNHYIAGNGSHWATSSSLIVWVYLHSNFRVF